MDLGMYISYIIISYYAECSLHILTLGISKEHNQET